MPPWLSSDVRDLISSMLKVNPNDRITVSKVLDHKWLKQGASKLNSLNMSPPAKDFDEEAFQCCRYLFQDLTEEQLRNKIKNFGYHTSTYLILRNNAEAKKVMLSSWVTCHNCVCF